MEVHHSHHVTPKKKWTEYLLEFFMLFLAVFLGFVAENIREHIAERRKEKGYIISMIKDLKTDTAKIAANQKTYKRNLDSLMAFAGVFNSIDSGYTTKAFILFSWTKTGFPDFIYTDATIQQLKNSGGFSVIENKDAIDSMMAYDAGVKRLLLNEAGLGQNFKAIVEADEELINFRIVTKEMVKAYNPAKAGKGAGIHNIRDFKLKKFDFLMTHDPVIENRYYNKLMDYINIMQLIKDYNYKPLKDQATRLIAFLRKEYHLENK